MLGHHGISEAPISALRQASGPATLTGAIAFAVPLLLAATATVTSVPYLEPTEVQLRAGYETHAALDGGYESYADLRGQAGTEA